MEPARDFTGYAHLNKESKNSKDYRLVPESFSSNWTIRRGIAAYSTPPNIKPSIQILLDNKHLYLNRSSCYKFLGKNESDLPANKLVDAVFEAFAKMLPKVQRAQAPLPKPSDKP